MKDKDITIKVENLEINYKFIQSFSFKKEGLKKTKTKVVNALKGVSFEINKGEIIGICGTNGSGKSTLLKAIAGIFSPDKGSIDLYGNSISLLSIGVGFQKKLSGYENIYISGLLLGFTKEEITNKMEEIIEFSTLKEHIHNPVSTYSSGMYSKLAFSITAILETDIMLIDEVFSVGDARFKKKSYAKMKELIENENRTVIIVSHSHKTLEKLCNSIIWLEKGNIKEIGPSKEIIEKYEKFLDNEI
ncbi:MAG: ABC transporter ATP-binding protein [bacterium]